MSKACDEYTMQTDLDFQGMLYTMSMMDNPLCFHLQQYILLLPAAQHSHDFKRLTMLTEKLMKAQAFFQTV